MPDMLFVPALALLCALILLGIHLMSRVKTALLGNRLSAASALLAILLTLWQSRLFSAADVLIALAIGLAAGLVAAIKVRIMAMPQFIALLNGLGGASSALIALGAWHQAADAGLFARLTVCLALLIGAVTLAGSLVAAGKLQRILAQHPLVWPGHRLTVILLLVMAAAALAGLLAGMLTAAAALALLAVLGSLLGLAFAVRVGGADMPITISLLNALSGVAGAVAGMAVDNILLVFVGSVVGASGLILTRIMCRAMNRSLTAILVGQTGRAAPVPAESPRPEPAALQTPADPYGEAAEQLGQARQVIIVPGYGMALAQAQQQVRELALLLEQHGASVRFAIHPVAGRMPGHMNVLLAEADVPYDQLFEMDAINPEFAGCDVALVVGANDVVNPAASTAEGTPIYGMPVLEVGHAKHLVICNYDDKPGYAGVPNPLYKSREHVTLLLGDAAETLQLLRDRLSEWHATEKPD